MSFLKWYLSTFISMIISKFAVFHYNYINNNSNINQTNEDVSRCGIIKFVIFEERIYVNFPSLLCKWVHQFSPTLLCCANESTSSLQLSSVVQRSAPVPSHSPLLFKWVQQLTPTHLCCLNLIPANVIIFCYFKCAVESHLLKDLREQVYLWGALDEVQPDNVTDV